MFFVTVAQECTVLIPKNDWTYFTCSVAVKPWRCWTFFYFWNVKHLNFSFMLVWGSISNTMQIKRAKCMQTFILVKHRQQVYSNFKPERYTVSRVFCLNFFYFNKLYTWAKILSHFYGWLVLRHFSKYFFITLECALHC